MDDLDLGQTIRGFVPGQKLFSDRFSLVRILGRGGMGIVWLARDEKLKREVALKFLPELMVFDEQAANDLMRETIRSQQLRHHHIVQVYDFVSDERSACIAMEYVDGPTLSALKSRQERNCLEPDEISTWVEELCDALSYAHEKAKVVHRDLKPANLMVDSRNQLKVADFGIARSVSDSMSVLTTIDRGTSGTLVYMSRQQLVGERATPSDDIYSLGATLYDLVTGKPPFYSGNIHHQIENIVPPPMSQRRAELGIHGKQIPSQWEETIAACLAKDPSHRPKSAGEVAQRFGLSEHFTPPRAQKIPVGTPIVRRPLHAFLGKRKGVLIAALLSLVVVGAVGGWWFRVEQRRREAEGQRQVTEQKIKEQKDNEAARQRELIEQQRLESERKTTAAADAEKEKQRMAAAERARSQQPALTVLAQMRAHVTQIADAIKANNLEAIDNHLKVIVTLARTLPDIVPADQKARAQGQLNNIIKIADLYQASAVKNQEEAEKRVNQLDSVIAFLEKNLTSARGDRTEEVTKQGAAITFAAATKEQPYVNSLGMKFVPVPGTGVLFSIWETRVKDFEAFVKATGHKAEGGMWSLDEKKKTWAQVGATWKDPGFAQTGEHAVCGVSWEDATAFCEWLTKEEQKAGRISASQSYRLPADVEWSRAVGLEKETGSTPESKDGKVTGVYPWGSKFPPPSGAGNYAGSEARTGGWPADWKTIDGYRDEYPRTAPAGSFSANEYGIYDLGGNVWEWCEEWYDAEKNSRVLRGASAFSVFLPDGLLSSSRTDYAPEYRRADLGFRCVLAVESSREAEEVKEKEDSFKAVAAATKAQPYENSLGMKFVPVFGTNVLFSIWETRVKDFEAFVKATGHKAEGGMWSLDEKKKTWAQVGATWKDPGFAQTGEHAVCGVSWEDATAFCEWLTKEEQKAGRISASQSYRLPADVEWSRAVGLEKETGSTPESKDGKVTGVYPWGSKFPPPSGAGNYAGSEARTGGWPSNWKTIDGYRDEYPRTAPAGSFAANEYGIYDLGGNVWEWCEDWWNAEKKDGVLRGASWSNPGLLSSYRSSGTPGNRNAFSGFRCVLVVESSR